MTAARGGDQKRSILPKIALFRPILAGATLWERMIGCLGALLGIGITGFVCALIMGNPIDLPLIVAPIGASAVLLFAVPASPLAQPWPIVGGNTLSALAGVSVTYFVADATIAAALAVALAILLMSLTRSLHPPGGAAALTAVIGGAAVTKAGFLFPFVPVAINSIILVVLGTLIHRLARRQYPHRGTTDTINLHGTADKPASLRVGFNSDDIDAALGDFKETLDIGRGDIETLLRRVEFKALQRMRGDLTCGDIMSRDVIGVSFDATPGVARARLLQHGIRILPVIGADGKLTGTVGLRELATLGESDPLPVTACSTAGPSDPAISLISKLTDGVSHAVIIVDDDMQVLGIITQTDMLATVARSLLHSGKPDAIVSEGQGI